MLASARGAWEAVARWAWGGEAAAAPAAAAAAAVPPSPQAASEREGTRNKKRSAAALDGDAATAPAQAGGKKKAKKKRKLNLKHLDRAGDAERAWPERLLVLDLNGVLVCRCKKKVPGVSENLRDTFGLFVYDRPYARQLLRWCRTRGFRLAFWTSATRPVADRLAKHLLTGQLSLEDDVEFVWAQEQCIRHGTDLASGGPIFRKPLRDLWADPTLGKRFTPANTVMLDNSEYKMQGQLENSVVVETFHPEQAAAADAELGQGGGLWLYLDGLSRHDGDVREYLREHRYGGARK